MNKDCESKYFVSYKQTEWVKVELVLACFLKKTQLMQTHNICFLEWCPLLTENVQKLPRISSDSYKIESLHSEVFCILFVWGFFFPVSEIV